MTNKEAIKVLESECGGCALRFDDMRNDDCYQAKCLAIQALENTQWIPVSERLPKKEKVYYLVTIDNGYTLKNRTEFCLYQDGKFYLVADGDMEENQSWEEECKDVIAWMPLPESYKEEEE